jgi:PKHD-type hydroxylase
MHDPFTIIRILNDDELQEAQTIAHTHLSYGDGKGSATGLARRLKSNLEAATDAQTKRLEGLITDALRRNEEFNQITFVQDFAKIIVSKYEAGMAYGKHVDAPAMSGVAVDYSFTLFLDEPEHYNGGELVIYTSDGEIAHKARAGEILLYPTTFLHEVRPLQSGTRHCVIGWLSSFIKCPIAREALRDIHSAAKEVLCAHNDQDLHLRLLQSYANLHRSISR